MSRCRQNKVSFFPGPAGRRAHERPGHSRRPISTRVRRGAGAGPELFYRTGPGHSTRREKPMNTETVGIHTAQRLTGTPGDADWRYTRHPGRSRQFSPLHDRAGHRFSSWPSIINLILSISPRPRGSIQHRDLRHRINITIFLIYKI